MRQTKTEEEYLAELRTLYIGDQDALKEALEEFARDIEDVKESIRQLEWHLQDRGKGLENLEKLRDSAVAEAVKVGVSVTEIARLTGLSRQQVYYRHEKLTEGIPLTRLQTNEGES